MNCSVNNLKRVLKLYWLWAFLSIGFVSTLSYAQTCSSLSGIVNTYAPVTNISGNVVTIGATSGATAPFAVGDNVVLIQMTGVSPAQTGSNMGKYELRTVTAVSGSSITLSSITNTYSFSTDKVQLVRAPTCTTGTVSATVTAKAWDGTTGGIVALKGGALTLNADIDATGKGFSQTNPPTTTVTTSLSTGLGSTSGRGNNGTDYGVNSGGTSASGGSGGGGGGVGGGGGSGGTGNGTDDLHRANGGNGGGLGGGGGGGQAPNPGDGSSGAGNDGGGGGVSTGSASAYYGSGGGGGGGIIGGGGGGAGGGMSSYGFGGSGGGGGAGGGGGGAGGYTGSGAPSGGGGGGGIKGVGNGRNASNTDSGSGSGGGSYGGGGGAASALLGGDDSAGGGGGGSWTGGGTAGKYGFNQYRNGGAGNAAVTTVIGNTDHYLNTTQPRIMMGGAGGNAQCQLEGKGGGIIILEFNNVVGNTYGIKSNGESLGLAPNSCVNIASGIGGGGGGGGGQMVLNIKNFTSTTNIEAKGGKGGDGNFNPSGLGSLWHGGTGGAGGGGGGIWVYGSGTSTNTGGQTVTVANTNLTSAGNTASATIGGLAGADTKNPKNGYRTGTGGAGGNGLIAMSADVPAWPVSCTPPQASVTPKTQSICVGGTATAYTATPSTGVEYKWYGPLADTTSAAFGTSLATTASYTPTGTALSTAGTKYYAVIVNNTGDAACADTAFVKLVVNAKPVIADGSATICTGEAVDLTSKITNYATYLSPVWTVGTAGGSAVSTPSSVKPTTSTTYVLVAQNAAGCKDTAQVVVTVNPKPNAGTDQSPTCVGNTPITTATLAATALAGGAWTQAASNPAGAVVTTPTSATSGITGLNSGVYQFIWATSAACSDTVKITIPNCACVTPDAGPNQTLVCAGSVSPTTTTLAPVTLGGTWTQQGTTPAVATITGNNVTGMTATGVYTFIYTVGTCTKSITVTVPTCSSPCGFPNCGTLTITKKN